MSERSQDPILKFEPPLPCCTWNGYSICGKPATVGYVWAVATGWVLQPVCLDCTKTSAARYGIGVIEVGRTAPEKEQPDG